MNIFNILPIVFVKLNVYFGEVLGTRVCSGFLARSRCIEPDTAFIVAHDGWRLTDFERALRLVSLQIFCVYTFKFWMLIARRLELKVIILLLARVSTVFEQVERSSYVNFIVRVPPL